MAKEFKDYDKKFGYLQGKTLAYEDDDMHFDLEGAEYEDAWLEPVKQWTREQIRHAVYFAPDAENWQRFRVSLKGFSTKQKLYRLQFRLAYMQRRCSGPEWEESDMLQNEQIRIDNYIGALIRGGLLNQKLEVIK